MKENIMKNSLLTVLCLIISTLFCDAKDATEVGYTAKYTIDIHGKTDKVQFVCLIPQTIEYVQQVHSINYSRPPYRVFDKDGNRYAEFLLLSEKGVVTIEISAQLTLFKHTLQAAKKGKKVCFEVTDKHLLSEKFIEKDDRLIQSIGLSVMNLDTLKRIRKLCNYVKQNMTYTGYNRREVGAAKALEQLGGDCSEFADVFVALCRSCHIPAMTVEGYMLTYSITPKHSWAEVYCGRDGWVRFDPTVGITSDVNKLSNKYIQLSMVRNDDVLNGGHFYHYTYWGDPVFINEDVSFQYSR
jgi:transglutaminase-like putative cysteine protease